MIKNTKADITHALRQVKCQRRIALTGSPLQNNLMEYYCVRLKYLCVLFSLCILYFFVDCLFDYMTLFHEIDG